MNAKEIRARARERLEARRADGLKSVEAPELGDGVSLFFHLPPSLSEVAEASALVAPFASKDGKVEASGAEMGEVFSRVVFRLAKDEGGERIWTDWDEFDAECPYSLVVRCVSEAGLFESLLGSFGDAESKAA